MLLNNKHSFMNNPYPSLTRLCLVAIAALVFYGFLLLAATRPHVTYKSWARDKLTQPGDVDVPWKDENFSSARLPRDKDVGRVTNRTLGFEKIIAIGLPERSDKRDALTLMGAVSGVDIDWVDGVKPSDIPEKAVPFGIELNSIHDNFLGSWRSHMNAIREVVRRRLSSALIMEDDIDWDVHLKTQLYDFALGARHIFPGSESQRHDMPLSPYGDTWDVLWIGHCGEPFPENLEENTGLKPEKKALMSTKYIIHDDDTVPPPDKVSNLVDWSKYPPNTRIVHRGAAPICSFAYAISQAGARKLLHALSVDGLHMAFDNSLAQLCRDAVYQVGHDTEEDYGFRCLSINPTIMFHHKAKGLMAADSDIQSYGKDGSTRKKGVTDSIKWSMRLNMKNVLMGKPIENQFPEEKEKEKKREK